MIPGIVAGQGAVAGGGGASLGFDTARTTAVLSYSAPPGREVTHSGASSYGNPRATIPIAAGSKTYFEIAHVAGGTVATLPQIGMISPTLGVTTSPTTNARIAIASNGRLYTGATTVGGYMRALVAGDVIGVAVDAAAGTVWFSLNGAWVGDPVAGTSPASTSAAGTWYPGAVMYAGGTLRAGFSPTDLSYPVPAGFTTLA